MDLKLRPVNECKYDAVSLGEVMLRLDPGEGRIRTARSFQVWEGGGEYNVIRGLRRCFGIRGAVGCSDRANTAISKATPEDFDFDYIFWRTWCAMAAYWRNLCCTFCTVV